MKTFRVGKYAVPLWLIIVLLVSAVGAVVLAEYLLNVNIPVNVEEPLEIIGYPSELSLFPGEIKEVNVTVYNHAPVNYSIMLDMNLNDSAYQNNYVTFNDEVYNVVPGQQDIATWFSVKSSAPSTNVTLSVSLKRVEGYSFSDNFDSTTLNSDWSTLDPDGGSSFNLSVNSGWLRITTTSPPYRDLYGPVAMNAPRILLNGISGDFTLETRIESNTDQEWESAGILVWKDSNNFIRLDRACGADDEQRIMFVADRQGTWGDGDLVLSSNLNPTYLRLVRQGNLFSGHCSSDGIIWTLVGYLTSPLGDTVDVGLDVVNVYHDGTFFADFDYFRIISG